MSSSESGQFLGDASSVSILGTVLLLILFLLFFTVMFLLCFHFFKKRLWHRELMSSSGRFVFEDDDGSVLATHQGLDPKVMRSLPILIFRSAEFKEGLECTVCLCEISEGEKARLLPRCNHGFHLDCIDMWFHSHATCPLCRNPVTLHSGNPSSGPSEVQASEENATDREQQESPRFPTNVLFWGSQDHVNAGGAGIEVEAASSSSKNACGRRMLAIEISNIERFVVNSFPSPGRSAEGDIRSPATRSRYLKRFLNSDKLLASSPCTPSAGDIEQGISENIQNPTVQIGS